MTCPSCRHSHLTYAEDRDGLPILECWRYPPVVVVDDDEITCVRPNVAEDDTCGEYQP